MIPLVRLTRIDLTQLTNLPSSVDNVEPKIVRVLEKVSSTIDKNEERCEETDRKDQHEMEWKQVALVIGNIITTNIKHTISFNRKSRIIRHLMVFIMTM